MDALKFYGIAAIVLALSYGATINVNDLAGHEIDSSHSELSPSKYEDISDIVTNNGDCPVHPKPADCAEIFENGFRDSGVYTIYPKNKIVSCGEIKVFCDMKTAGGGWTVIQRRGNFKRATDYFYKNWKEYKNGFGNLQTEFWLGNDYIHALTNQKKYSVRFDLAVDSEKAYATYDTFWIENEELKYRLYIEDYSGTAGDSMGFYNGKNFSTKDSKNNPVDIKDCAKGWKGGWWYNNCALANLNGLNLRGNYNKKWVEFNGTYWQAWKNYDVSLTDVEIKIRPFNF